MPRPDEMSEMQPGARRALLRSAGQVLFLQRADRRQPAPILICLAAWVALSLILWAALIFVLQHVRAL